MADEPTLQRGSQGQDVVDLQTWLSGRGYDTGTIDGDFAERTEAAVRQFQTDNGLTVDGVVGPDFWAALGAGVGPSAVADEPPASHVVFAEVPAVEGMTLTYRAVRPDREPIAAGAHTDSWSIEAEGNPLVASDTYPVPEADAPDGEYAVSRQLPEIAPGYYTIHVALTIDAGLSEVGHATFTAVVPESHIVFAEEPAVDGLILTYRAVRPDRGPIAAGAHTDSWSIEIEGNPLIASDTYAVPEADAPDGEYFVSRQLPELEPGSYKVHVALTVDARLSEIGHADFTV